MKIYTKTGDKGETGLFGGERIAKHHPRIAAYGDVDELNAVLGMARSYKNSLVDGYLQKIQNDLFDIGAVLASPDKKKLEGKATGFIRPEDISYLEKSIDQMETELPALKTFILPGGSPLASVLHLARTVCRRAERAMTALAAHAHVSLDSEVLVYINRLSDFLFVLARWVNFKASEPDSAWKKK